MSQYRTSEIEKTIQAKLHRLRVKLERIGIVSGLLYFLSYSIGIAGIAIITEALFYFNSTGRTFLIGAGVLAAAVLFMIFFVYPLLVYLGVRRRKTDEELARIAGMHFPAIQDRLLNLLQLSRERREGKNGYSPELIDASFADLADTVAHSQFTDAVTYEKPRRIGRSFLYSILFFVILFLVTPGAMFDSFYRLVHFGTEFSPPKLFTLYIEPGDVEVIRGDSVRIIVRVEGDLQYPVALLIRQEGQIEFEEVILNNARGSLYAHIIPQIRRTTEYYAHSKDEETSKHTIKVVDRPAIRNLQVRLTFPEYTGIPPRNLDDNVGNITALRGTDASLEINANKELVSARIQFQKNDTLDLEIAGTSASGRFALRTDDSYTLHLEDMEGIRNAEPIEYHIRIIEDEYPLISFIRPGENVIIDESLRLPLLIRIRDDYGFTRLQLGYRLVQSRYEMPQEEYTYVDIPLQRKRSTDEVVEYLWNLQSLRLAPEDVLSYHAVIYDNDMVSGPKKTQSDSYLLRLPSLDEVFADMDRRQSSAMRDLEYSSDEAEKLRRDLEEIRRELQLAQHEMTWERQQRMEEMLQRYEELQKNLEETAADLEEMIENMQQHQVLSTETLEKYLELQQLYEQLNDPEFKEAMDKLREAMERMDPDQLREAMRNMTLNDEQFRQSLERTINLLKRIQIEQKLDELVKRAEQIVDEQQQVADELEQTEATDSRGPDQASQKMDDLKQQLEQVQKALEELRQRMEEFPTEMPLQELTQTEEHLDEAGLQEQIAQMQQQMQSGNMQQAASQHENIQQSLQQMQQNMAAMQQALLENQMMQVLNEMRRSLRNLNELSKRQEQLRDDTKSLEANSPLFPENARQQNEVVQDLSTVINDLISLSQKTFAITPDMGRAIGNAMQQMRAALERLDSRSGSQAGSNQEGAMASLNEASVLLQQSLQAMLQGGGSGGMQAFLQQMQQMAGQQQRINLDTSQLGEGQMTMEQQAQMGRLAAEQEAVRRSLEELQNEMSGTSDRQRILGDLERIEQEMREVVSDLQASDLQPETLRRQERILSRLLDAQRSVRERDFEERRESRPGEQFVRESPPEIDLTTQEGRDRLREEMLRAVREGYSRDYELLIRRYFDLLRELED
jgi:hypothetical protein